MATHHQQVTLDIPYDPIKAPSPYIVTKSGKPLDPENLLPGYELVATPEGKPKYAIYTRDLVKSPNDDRLYRLIMLENGMEALLISDAKTDKASASMEVRVGHLSDPEDLQGLAHFCEHLMFMGTEKYPSEREYSEFLTQNAGSSNAFTGMDNTCYYFDVHPDQLNPALDRFAQFFIAPLFDASCTEREANAVNSENSKNLQADMWRLFQLDKSTSSRDHSYWRFGTGNKETLWDEPLARGEDVRSRLIEWQERHYSANLMKLVVLGKESLDEMAQTVVDTFSPAPNRNLPVPHFGGSPLSEKELGTAVFVKALKDQRHLEMSFPFPDPSPFYLAKPSSFLSHLIGHEGKGSILSCLKNKGWANVVSAGGTNGAKGFDFFKVQVDLTKEGLEHYEDVAAIVFKYIDLIRSSPPQEWAFDEVSRLSEISFRFKEKGAPTTTAMRLSLEMSNPYPRHLLLSAPYLNREWQPQTLQAFENLLTRDNCRITIGSREPVEGNSYEMKEKWYGTEYSIVPMSENLLKGKNAVADEAELALPPPNSFIPTDFEIKERADGLKPAKRPINLSNSPTARLWHKKDDRWFVPRAGAFFLLRSPIVDDSAANLVRARLFTELVSDSLVEYSYDADLAGLRYNFDIQADGILLTVDGYNDKLPAITKVIFETMKNLQVNPKRFEIIVDQLKRAYLNYRLEQPYSHTSTHLSLLTKEISWTHDELLAEMDIVTVDDLQSYIAKLLARMHIETLVHGNMLTEEATNLLKVAETTIAASPLTLEEQKSHRSLIVPEGKHLYREELGNQDNLNSAVEQFTFIGDVSDPLIRVKLSLLANIVQEPLFDQLRTKEQLGYIVSSGLRLSIAFAGLRVVVQSERDAPYVEGRIDSFWEEFKAVLDAMSQEEFEKFKASVVSNKLEDHKNMWQESSHLWLGIHSGYYDFLQRENDAALVKTLTKQQMVDFYNTYFFDSPEHRIRRLSVHVQSQRIHGNKLLSLVPSIMALNVPVDQAQMAQLAGSSPSIPALKAFSTHYLGAHGKSPEEINAFLALVDGLGTPVTPEDVTIITDRTEWRSKQTPSDYAKPVEEASDLLLSKL